MYSKSPQPSEPARLEPQNRLVSSRSSPRRLLGKYWQIEKESENHDGRTTLSF